MFLLDSMIRYVDRDQLVEVKGVACHFRLLFSGQGRPVLYSSDGNFAINTTIFTDL